MSRLVGFAENGDSRATKLRQKSPMIRLLRPHNRPNRKRQSSNFATNAMVQSEALEPRLLLSGVNGPTDAEHARLMALVPDSAVTHTATRDGAWSDPGIWADGNVPTKRANVAIPAGVTVTIAGNFGTRPISTIRVDGTLRFSTTEDSHLLVETIVVREGGRFEAGSKETPVPNGVKVQVTFADTGPLSSATDPLRLARGLVSMGEVSIVGARTQSHLKLRTAPVKGDTVLQLAHSKVRWRVGDQVVIPGVSATENQDEQRVIEAIDGNAVTLSSPLDYNHQPPLKKLRLSTANLTRNIVFESENPSVTWRRGHVMFMRPEAVHVEYAAFNGLGRTDKRTPVEDARFDHRGNLVEGTGENQRGRYSVHFHQGGATGKAAYFGGNAVVDSPGWGVVNHSSHVNMIGNVVYHVGGSAFVTEAGDEIGNVRNNIAIRSTGSGESLLKRTDRQDFGHAGNGFWFQGAGVKVSGNIASGHANIGFMYFVRAQRDEAGNRVRFLTKNLKNKSLANGKDDIDIRSVPIRHFSNNTAFAVSQGFQTWFHLPKGQSPGVYPSVVDNLTVWNATSRGAQLTYSSGLVFRDSLFVGNMDTPEGAGFKHHPVTENIRYENLRVEGFAVGIDAPVRGHNEIAGGTFRNVVNIRFNMSQDSHGYFLGVDDAPTGQPVRFKELRKHQLQNRTPNNVDFYYSQSIKHHQNPNALFVPTTMRINAPGYDNRQMFFAQQAADFVPFSQEDAEEESIPLEFVGLTNGELKERYGLAIGGHVAPDGSILDENLGVLAGDPQEPLPQIILRSGLHAEAPENYRLNYQVNGDITHEKTALAIEDGWNTVTRQIDGQTRTVLIHGDVSPPQFELAKKTPTSLNPIDRDTSLFIYGRILDSGPSQGRYKKWFNLSDFEKKTASDGREYLDVQLDVKDRSGNVNKVSFKMYIDPDTPPLHELFRNDVDARTIPDLLLDP